MKEFYFSAPGETVYELGDAFAASGSTEQFLVANVDIANTEVFAPEINFYLHNSTAPAELLLENIRRLYEIRAAAFDTAQQTELSMQVGRRVLVISGWDQAALQDKLEQLGFTVITVETSQITSIERHDTGLRATVQAESEVLVIEADHILWGNCPQEYRGRRFIYDHELLGHDATVDAIMAATGQVRFKNFVRYDSSLCLLHKKRSKVCGQCVDICPTGAIFAKLDPQRLEISDIECIGCGSCVGMCPTGAMDSARMTRSGFLQLAGFYRDRVALIMPARLPFKELQLELGEQVLPLVIEDEQMLDEWHLLSFLQTSGYPALFFNDSCSPLTRNVVQVINDMFQKKYQRNGIHLCENIEQLQTALKSSAVGSPFAALLYDPDERGVSKRTAMARRLGNFVGGKDYGTVLTGPYLHYGMLRLDRDKCTLCLSCAEGCTSGALSVHPEDNTLQFTPSLCTCCGYCVATCPEDRCLDIFADQLVLHPAFFQRRVVAQDELFKCVECGKGFGPAKSITKIGALMEPKFGGDKARIRALYCCPDCKAKVMLQTLHREKI